MKTLASKMSISIQNRTLFFGDNLKILEERIPEGSIDLIYLDPPFNSNRNYNVLFKEGKVDSSAQIHAFEDTWEWTDDTVRLLKELKTNSNPKVAILINSLTEFIGHNPMMAYLVNMTARVIPLYRVLKSTGSLYLHCDSTASHCLKIILDVIFGTENFRNEIVWERGTASGGKAGGDKFVPNHDIILFYVKDTDKKLFNRQYIEYTKEYIEQRFKYTDEKGKRYRLQLGDRRQYLDDSKGKPVSDIWTDIFPINPMAKEKLGYPTQKPEALLERIIEASSKEGDWILDPFCGCGTTVAVAEKLHRNWVGIDISMQAIKVIEQRLKDHYSGIKIYVDGIPMDYESASRLAENDKFAFQDWAISLIGAYPPSGESRKGADRGIDGVVLFYEKVDLRNPKLRKIIIQIKGGGTGRGDIAKLKGDIDREDAPMGVLVTLHDPTAEMKRETALAGEYKYSNNISFPKIQILSIKDWFNGLGVKLPTDTVNPFKRAEAKADQQKLI